MEDVHLRVKIYLDLPERCWKQAATKFGFRIVAAYRQNEWRSLSATRDRTCMVVKEGSSGIKFYN